MIVPADEMLFDCEDVLDRLLPCIRQILDYLRAQGRHPDTSLLAPTELFRATGLYFTGDEINRLLEAFNGEPLADQVRAGSYGMPEPLPPCIGTRALLSVLRARLSTVTYRRPGGGRRPKSGAARPKSAGPKTGGSQRGSGAGIWKKSGEGGGPPSAAPSDSGAGETPLQLEHARAALAQAEMEGYGPEAIRVRRSEVVELSNQRAVQMLAKGELPTCYKLLDEAQRLLDYEGELSPLAAVTANNLACYYRRKQQLDKALHQLRRASQIEAQCAAPRGPADTQINLCVVLSELGRHEEAAGHAGHALRLVEAEAAAAAEAGEKLSADRAAVHASALHNLSVEQGCLGLLEKAEASRSAAWTVAEE